MRLVFCMIGFVLAVGGYVQYASLSPRGISVDETAALALLSREVHVRLLPGMDREEIVQSIADGMGFDETSAKQLHDTYRAMQWDALNDLLVPYIVSKEGLSEKDEETLLTHATIYLDAEEDVLEPLYVSGDYTFSSGDSVVSVAEKLIAPVRNEKEALVPKLLDQEDVNDLLAYLQNASELLPDLVPLPPQDIVLQDVNGRRLLTFTTIYYNQGRGNLELRADPKTIGTPGDFDREVFQRIYQDDGTYRDRTAGTFHWHTEHLHYHFRDFIEYTLEAIHGTEEIDTGVLAQKSTFCIRDVSRVLINDVSSTSPAEYRICGRERQGVTVGWGDAYFNTYVDQNLDITDLPSGTYRLTFIANPADRFDEITKENNISSATIEYNKEEGVVKMTGTEPAELPQFEHIHVEQDL